METHSRSSVRLYVYIQEAGESQNSDLENGLVSDSSLWWHSKCFAFSGLWLKLWFIGIGNEDRAEDIYERLPTNSNKTNFWNVTSSKASEKPCIFFIVAESIYTVYFSPGTQWNLETILFLPFDPAILMPLYTETAPFVSTFVLKYNTDKCWKVYSSLDFTNRASLCNQHPGQERRSPHSAPLPCLPGPCSEACGVEDSVSGARRTWFSTHLCH